MTESDVQSLLKEIRDMRGDLYGMKAELREFKRCVSDRLAELSKIAGRCQAEPQKCANARRLDEHLKNHSGKFDRVFVVLGFCIGTLSLIISFAVFAKGGKL